MKSPCTATDCASKACLDFPVCRPHVRSWLNSNPIEAVKRLSPVSCAGRSGVRWAEERGLPHGQYVDVAFRVGKGSNLVHVVVAADEALVLADYYEEQGSIDAANMLRRSTGIVGKQADLFADQLVLGGAA